MKPVIIAENIYKKYSLNANEHLNYGLTDLINVVLNRKKNDDILREDEFWAVNDISFSLEQGDTLGLIGRNGCGKTTLLKMLNGIIKPTKGKILIDGNVQALINLGAGFNQNLSGRENILNVASLRGLSKKQTLNIIDDIINFSELEEFIDSPVGTYSSGMHARLGFATSINLQPDILLIDEILSVGDFAFRNKCFIRMNELKKKGVTIILVSHSHTQVQQLCEKSIWIHKGKLIEYGDSKEVIHKYLDFLNKQEIIKSENKKNKDEKKNKKQKKSSEGEYGPILDEYDRVNNISVKLIADDKEVDHVQFGTSFKIKFAFNLLKSVNDLNVSLVFFQKNGLRITAISTLNGDFLKKIHNGFVHCEVIIEEMILNPGEYVIVMPVHEGHSYLYRNVVKEFIVTKSKKMTWGLVSFNYEYSLLS